MSRAARDLLTSACFGAMMAALAISPADAGQNCRALASGFGYCADDDPWLDARRVEFRGGVGFELDDWWLEASELPEEYLALGSLDEVIDQFERLSAQEASTEGLDPPEILRRERFDTAHLQVVSLIGVVELGEDQPVPFVGMIVESDGRRIALSLDSMAPVEPDTLHDALRQIVEHVRPMPEDE